MSIKVKKLQTKNMTEIPTRQNQYISSYLLPFPPSTRLKKNVNLGPAMGEKNRRRSKKDRQ